MRHWGNLEGLIPLLGGIYGLLMALGVLPASDEWRRRFGATMQVICPIIILFGIGMLLGLFG